MSRRLSRGATITNDNIGDIQSILKNLIALDDGERKATQRREIDEAKSTTRELSDWISQYKAEQKAKDEKRAALKAAKSLDVVSAATKEPSPTPEPKEPSTEPESGVESGTEDGSCDSERLDPALPVIREDEEVDITFDETMSTDEQSAAADFVSPLVSQEAYSFHIIYSSEQATVQAKFAKTADRASRTTLQKSRASITSSVNISVIVSKPVAEKIPAMMSPVPAKKAVKPASPLPVKKSNLLSPTPIRKAPVPKSPTMLRKSESIKRERPEKRLGKDDKDQADFGSIHFLPQKSAPDATSLVCGPAEKKGLRAKLWGLKPSFIRRRDKQDKSAANSEYRDAKDKLKAPAELPKEEPKPVVVPANLLTPLAVAHVPETPKEPEKEEEVLEEEPSPRDTLESAIPTAPEEDPIAVSIFGRRLPKPRFIMRLGTPKRREGPSVVHPAVNQGEAARFVARRAPPTPSVTVSEDAFVSSLPTVTLKRAPNTFLRRLEAAAAASAIQENNREDSLLRHRTSLKSVARPVLAKPQAVEVAPSNPFPVQLKAAGNDHRMRPILHPKRCQQAAFTPRWRRLDTAQTEEEVAAAEEEEEAPPPPPAEEEDEEDYDEEPAEEAPKPRKVAQDDAGMSEAQEALAAARRKQTEQNDDQIQEYIEMRADLQRKLNDEIEELKSQVAERKIERAQEQEEMFERMRIEDDRRKAEEEERKQKQLEDKARRDQMKKKGGSNFNVPNKPAGKNFTIVKKDPEEAAAPPPIAGGIPGGPSKEELAAKKAEHISTLMRQYNFDGLGSDDLKTKIKDLHAQICKMEAARYDLEKRQERQDYDMRELEERQKQQARQSALKKGLDAEEAANSNHPPKVQVQSKYDRQIDRRSYVDRHVLFDKPAPVKKWKVYHGTPAPPAEWGRKETEELENIRKAMEPRKYQEQVKVEGAKPPVPFVPPVVPETDALEVDPDAEVAEAPKEAAKEEPAKAKAK